MRIRVFALTIGLLFALFAHSQEGAPVTWKATLSEVSGNSCTLSFTADIEEHWHLYSQFLDTTKIGPFPTSFDFEDNGSYQIPESLEEGKPIVKMDPVFEMELGYFENTVTFTQKIIATGDAAPHLRGYINFMACDEGKCIFPDPMPFDLKPGDSKELKAGILDEGAHDDGVEEPVSWSISSRPLGNDEYELTFSADIEQHWHLYSQHLESQFGPVPTSFSFADSTGGYELVGETTEGTPLVSYDPNFEMDLSYYENAADFVQKVKFTDPSKSKVSGFLSFMVCDDEKCLPPEDIDFRIDVKSGNGSVRNILEAPTENSDTGRLIISTVDLDNPKSACIQKDETKDTTSLWKLFLLGIGGGLLALITPCVFPMIPLTVSFFTKGSEEKGKGLARAITYGFFIFLIYLLLSVPFHIMDNISPDILNDISTNVPLNIFFFVVFIVFAISFFGYFEITMPSSFTNKMDDKASKAGGLIGIFFMALTLALVSFSCTGPILGSLLAGSLTSEGGAMQLTAGMGGFGFALALPFALFAAFPGMMNALPQSGGWLNSVKVVLGFAEVALAFKFLSNADLVSHWGLLKYETFMIIWILCAIGIVLYLMGKIKFPHDSPVQKYGLGRVFFITLFATTSIYLITGFMYNEETKTYKSKALMSGLAPPAGYSYVYPLDCPHSLNCFHDYYEGMAYAKQVGKPVLLDFTGYACVNCRKMEEHVWDKDGVFDMIKDDYVLISLYVDDKELLPESEQRVYELNSGVLKNLKTKGHKWSTLQSETFAFSTQPYYALLDPNGQLLTNPVAYTPDVNEYREFLRCGLNAFEGESMAEN